MPCAKANSGLKWIGEPQVNVQVTTKLILDQSLRKAVGTPRQYFTAAGQDRRLVSWIEAGSLAVDERSMFHKGESIVGNVEVAAAQ